MPLNILGTGRIIEIYQKVESVSSIFRVVSKLNLSCKEKVLLWSLFVCNQFLRWNFTNVKRKCLIFTFFQWYRITVFLKGIQLRLWSCCFFFLIRKKCVQFAIGNWEKYYSFSRDIVRIYANLRVLGVKSVHLNLMILLKLAIIAIIIVDKWWNRFSNRICIE